MNGSSKKTLNDEERQWRRRAIIKDHSNSSGDEGLDRGKTRPKEDK